MKRMHNPKDKTRYDYEYVKNIFLWLDIKIFALTILHLFGSGKGK